MRRLVLGLALSACSGQEAAAPVATQAPGPDYTGQTVVVASIEEPPDTWLIHEDERFRFFGRHYGSAPRNSVPGFFVYVRSVRVWLQILEVSTTGGTFGRSPTHPMMSVGWDHAGLRTRRTVRMPLGAPDSHLSFPDRIVVEKDTYRLQFHAKLAEQVKDPRVLTELRIDVRELAAAARRGR